MIDAVSAATAPDLPPQARVLNATEAALVWVLSWSGDPKHVIAAKLETMPSKVADILKEATHVGSKDQASKLLHQRNAL